jgi:hypothetical protein
LPDNIPIPTEQAVAPESDKPKIRSLNDVLADSNLSRPQAATGGGFADTVKNYWHAMNGVLDTSGLAPVQGWVDEQNAALRKIVTDLKSSNHPYVAAMAEAYSTAQELATNTVFGASTPKNVALALSGGGVISKAANAYFVYQGSKTLIDNFLHGDNTSHEGVVKNTLAGAQVVMSALGLGTSIAESAHNIVQNSFGLKGDLAAKVQEKVAARIELETAAKAAMDTRQSAGDAQTAMTQDIAKGTQKGIGGVDRSGVTGKVPGGEGQVPAELPVKMGVLMADAAQVVQSEKARMDNMWGDIAKEAGDRPVIGATDLRAKISNIMTDAGVLDKDVPSGVWKGIPNDVAVTSHAPSAGEQVASINAQNMLNKGMSVKDVRDSLPNLGYSQDEVDRIMSMTNASPGKSDLTFSDLNKIKNNLWDMKLAAANPTIETAVSKAHQEVMQAQEQFAVKKNFGNSNKQFTIDGEQKTQNGMYQGTKTEYFNFMHNLGGGEMYKFLKATEGADQEMMGHVDKWMGTTPQVNFVKNLFRANGVDSSPLDAALAEEKSVPAGAKQRTQEIAQATKDAVSAIGTDSAQAINEIGKKNALISGQSDFDLEGKNTIQIRQDAIERLASNAKAAGITRPLAWLQIMIGTGRMLAGSMMATGQVASGSSRIAVEKMLQSKSFQDWAIQESGVDAKAVPAFLKTIAHSYPEVLKLAQSGVLGGALNNARSSVGARITPDQQQPNPAPTAPPAQPSSQIAIAQ